MDFIFLFSSAFFLSDGPTRFFNQTKKSEEFFKDFFFIVFGAQKFSVINFFFVSVFKDLAKKINDIFCLE